MVKVSVKWGKCSYDVEVDGAEGLDTFQAALFSLTSVPVERQKLLYKGKFLKTDTDVQALPVDAKLTLMGTADALPAAPAKAVLFEEDLTDKDRVALAPSTVTSAGLVNLGNTCYMNSTLQAFRAVPELKTALIRYGTSSAASSAGGADPEHLVTSHLGKLMLELEHSSTSITPMMFTTVFRSSFAQFAERNSEGHWAQQDADECLQTLIQAMAHKLGPATLQPSASSPSTTTAPSISSPTSPPSVIDSIFGGTLQTTMWCAESSDEPVRKTVEPFRKLRCQIDSKIAYLSEGLLADLQGEMEMRSTALGRPAVWKKSSAVASLPRYLIVQFVRFDWKRDTQKKAKVLKKVEFPFRLDVGDLCTPSLKRSLLAARRALKDEEDSKKGLTSLNRSKPLHTIKDSSNRAKEEEKKEAAPGSFSSAPPMDTADESGELQPVTSSGYYDLFAVITHKGRYADSGHYIGWSKASEDKDSERWWKYDDDTVSEVKSDDIKQLSGGGDWHMAYLLLYKLDADFVGRRFTEDTAVKGEQKAAVGRAKEEEGKAPSTASPP